MARPKSARVSGFRRRGVGIVAALLLAWAGLVGWSIVTAGDQSSAEIADAALILGAAVYGTKPSPVFEERIRHGIALYKAKRVRVLLFTGGYGEGSELAESEVARTYALEAGVPNDVIIIENISRTTKGNLVQAKRLLDHNSLSNVLLVTDPLHVKRALRMSSDLGIAASPSPTPTTRYRSWKTKSGFLLREIYFYHVYLLTGQ